MAHEVETRGYVPAFIDATGIEVDGALFERARKDWRTLLEWTAGMVPAGMPAWLRADNAHYRGGWLGSARRAAGTTRSA